MSRAATRQVRSEEWGFTLPEVLITIVIMGIVFAIASSAWSGVVDSGRVDSAANQLASDLRKAHTSATNRLGESKVVMDTSNPTTYQMGPTGSLSTRYLPEGARIGTTATITFNPNGSASSNPSSVGWIRVKATSDDAKFHDLEVNTATSRVKLVD